MNADFADTLAHKPEFVATHCLANKRPELLPVSFIDVGFADSTQAVVAIVGVAALDVVEADDAQHFQAASAAEDGSGDEVVGGDGR